MIELKTPAEIERMHAAGRFVAEVLSEIGRVADVGVNLLDLEHHARGMITWNITDPGVDRVAVYLVGKTEKLFGQGGPAGEKQTGPWLRPGLVF